MSKLPHVGTTIFTVMSKLATENNAINLAQGFPNFPVDSKLTDILKEISTKQIHQYMPMGGYPPLLEKISHKIHKNYNRILNAQDEILITAGATQGIYTVIQAFIGFGDEAIILDPCYDCYDPAIILAGGKAIHISLEHDFSIDWNKLESKISNNTKILVINNPHNPSGKIFKESDFIALEQILNKNPNLLLLSDEVYEYITFENKHISINTREKIRDRSIIVSSFGKTFHITGWKIGYLVAPKRLLDEIKKVHQFLVFCVNSVAQVALSEYMDYVDETKLGEFYQEKRDLFSNLLKESRFELIHSEGTYFQVASFSSISDESDVKFTKRLTIENGVASIPMSVFHENQQDNKLIRFCFAKDTDTIIKATEKLCKI